MKIKKCTSLFLVFLLLISNMGFAFDVHYCGDAIASVSIKTSQQKIIEQKCCAVNKKDSSCCKDTVVHIEKKADSATIKSFIFQVIAPFLKPVCTAVFLKNNIVSKNNIVLDYCVEANAPPLFKLFSQFIFYA